MSKTYVVTNAALFPSLPLPANALIFRNGLSQTQGVHYDAVNGTFRFRSTAGLTNGDRISVVSRSVGSGPLASLPASPSPGDLYFATDEPDGQWLFGCSAKAEWIQLLNIGGSGALQIVDGSLDINLAVVPLLTQANTFTRLTLLNGLTLATGTQPDPSADWRGTFWFTNNGALKDSLQVCVFDGSAYVWATLY
jgi:hypothetical protein